MDIEKIEQNFSPTPDGKCSEASGGMVATAFPEATQAGVQMLEQGGNAIDAACAAALALGVCEPQASGVGGQTMALLYIHGKAIAVNGSGRVPSLGHRSQFSKDDLTTGYRGTTVPSTPAVLGYLHRKYGKLPWVTIVAPARDIAREGYHITKLQHNLQKRELPNFEKVASGSGTRYFLKNGSEPYPVGELFRQPELADLLEIIARQGAEAFYRGEIAQTIEDDMRKHQGFLRAEDLAYIPWPVESNPISMHYNGLTIVTTPPPSPGRIMLLVLKLCQRFYQAGVEHSPLQKTRFFVETLRQSILEHKRHPIRYELYDPASDPVLTDDAYVRDLFRKITEKSETPLPTGYQEFQGGETTHLSVMDYDGNAVGITQSINLVYGSKAAAQGLGFLYNNYLTDSVLDQPEHPHFLRPNGIPASMVCPTIVLRNQQPWLVTGSPGSERIISTVAQFLLHIFEGALSLDEAMRRPRLHCSGDGVINLESERFEREIITDLSRSGYELTHREAYAFYLGAIHTVLKCQTIPGFQGVAEIRRDGIARGCQQPK